MSQDVIDALFAPFEYKSLRLRNRIVMSPMTRLFSPDGWTSAEVAAYYARRALGEVGLIISEGAFIDREKARNHRDIPWLNGERLQAWQKVVDDVHAAGAGMAPQLWHVGGVPFPRPIDPPFATELESPSGLIGTDLSGGRTMTEEDIADVVASFVRTATAAKALGFDAIEFHGAHGYVFDQFFWSETNKRGDRYGGSRIGERTRFAAEVIRATRKAVGEDFVLLFRMSQWKLGAYDARIARDPDDLEEWVRPLVDAGVDIFDCSQRRFWQPEFDGSDLNLAGWVKKVSGCPTITVGSVGLSVDSPSSDAGGLAEPAPMSIRQAAERLDKGEFDLVAVGRALIADPEWPRKVRERRFAELSGYSPEMTNTLV